MSGNVEVFGTVGILNVGAGDTKLTFDKSNPAECIRAARIVKDMLRRGYALLVEIEKDGRKVFQRVHDFREDTAEYIIADFDPITAEKADADEEAIAATNETSAEAGREEPPPNPAPRPKGRPRKRSIDASTTRAVAVARSAGG